MPFKESIAIANAPVRQMAGYPLGNWSWSRGVKGWDSLPPSPKHTIPGSNGHMFFEFSIYRFACALRAHLFLPLSP